MQVIKFQEIIQRLQNLDGWLQMLGVTVQRQDRIHRAIEVVQTAAEGWERFCQTREPTKIGNINDYHFGITEALEFSNIYLAFENEDREILGLKLSRALQGPFRPIDENQGNSDGRNIMFELALGAELKLQGADVTLGEPDLTLRLGNISFLVECKRPAADHSIRANIRGAAGQLDVKLRAEADLNARGIIAISVSRALNPGMLVFATPTPEGDERLGDKLEALMRANERQWARNDSLNPRITAILFHVATPSVIGRPEDNTNRLVRMSYTTIMDTGRDKEAFAVLQRELQPLFQDQRQNHE